MTFYKTQKILWETKSYGKINGTVTNVSKKEIIIFWDFDDERIGKAKWPRIAPDPMKFSHDFANTHFKPCVI